MTLSIAKKEIVVLGEEDFIAGFKLAGVRKSFVINANKPTDELREIVSKVLTSVYEDPSVGVVIIQYKLKEVAEKVLKATQHPLILFLPSGREVGKVDVKELYSRQIKSFLGVSMEV